MNIIAEADMPPVMSIDSNYLDKIIPFYRDELGMKEMHPISSEDTSVMLSGFGIHLLLQKASPEGPCVRDKQLLVCSDLVHLADKLNSKSVIHQLTGEGINAKITFCDPDRNEMIIQASESIRR